MTSASPPPIALLCDPEEPLRAPNLSSGATTLATQALAALDGVPAFLGAHARERALRLAAASVSHLAAALSVHTEPVAVDELAPRSPAQAYFRIRTARLDRRQTALQAAVVLTRALADLTDAPVAGTDIAREIAAFGQVIADLAGLRRATFGDPFVPPGADGSGKADPAADVRATDHHRSPEETWWHRWILAHQIHALFNVHAAVALGDALQHLAVDADRAVADLERVTTYVRGFAPARAHALALPAAYYGSILRPTMLPPLVPAPLSGGMHVEYKAYRLRLNELLLALPEPIEHLVVTAPRLAFAREDLLAADLAEAERHLSLVEPVVGNARSLVQAGKSADNALSVLRRIRARRAARYAPYLRHNETDRVTGPGAAD